MPDGSPRKKRAIGIILLIIIILFVFCWFYEPSSPNGIYYDKNIACGHGCWVFKDGKIFTECEDQELHYTGMYEKIETKWISGNNTTNQTVIVPTLFGIKLIGPSWKNGKIFFPRDIFSWTIDCKEWIKSHLF